MSATTLVVGATGLLGQEIVRALQEAGQRVRAIVREGAPASKRAHLDDLGVESVPGDLRDRRSLNLACVNVTTVVSSASAVMSSREGDGIETVDQQGTLELVDAAECAGAEHFVYVSFPPTAIDSALQRAKRAVERRLASSRMTYTILQPVDFMEVWLSPALGFDPLHGSVRIFGNGHQPISWISIHDVARFTAAAVEARWRNLTVQLGGPDPLSPLQVLSIFAELGMPSVKVEHVPEEVLVEQLGAARDEREEAFAASMLSTARGQRVDIAMATKLLPGRLRSVRDHALQSFER